MVLNVYVDWKKKSNDNKIEYRCYRNLDKINFVVQNIEEQYVDSVHETCCEYCLFAIFSLLLHKMASLFLVF